MRVLAARFADREVASRVLRQLRAAYDLGPHDVETAPLGGADDPGGLTLLAGRFDDRNVAEVRCAIEENGGQIVADVDEGWTQPRMSVLMGANGQRGFEERRTPSAGRPAERRMNNAVTHRGW